MYKNMSFLAVIPARGGSKGIPGKNIINVNGKPLIQYTVDAAKKSKYIDRIVVSTDDSKIADVSIQCGAEVPFLRPENLANDTAKTIDVLIHTLEELNKLGSHFDYIVLLQPTQPLRTNEQIDLAIENIVLQNAESLVSITEVSEHPVLFRTLDPNGVVHNLLNTNSTIRRQDFPKIYRVNGSIYINKINENFNSNTSLNDNKLAFLMGREFDIDIDEPFDLEVLKLILDQKKQMPSLS
ncbi:acylneuraminate cytidylyltransferase family protein [Metabacillus litoralis]|uniref:acylneuraminate cytidylyltransferase family protein n=1 Tax=Metabacillus litoralis TaxID=152268 RepID=UPI000EF5A3BB|nr:acylneuraminate cytidylyltransferase family protein [Metabacillus litoralis]